MYLYCHVQSMAVGSVKIKLFIERDTHLTVVCLSLPVLDL